MLVDVVIPAYNEEITISKVIADLLAAKSNNYKIRQIVVTDNNSSDLTAKRATEAGAKVVFEPERGYGAACLKGISECLDSDLIVFLDADGSDSAAEWLDLVETLTTEKADLVIGNRLAKDQSKKTLPFHQAFGNKLAAFLIRLKYKQKCSDLGPFRCIRTEVLKDLKMEDRSFGWTIEMQLKAFKLGYKVIEIPVTYRDRQGGKSKISGTIRGSFLAGKIILTYLFKDYAGKLNVKTSPKKAKS